MAARRSSYVPLYAKRLAINYACPASHVAVLRVCLINNESPVLDTLLNPLPNKNIFIGGRGGNTGMINTEFLPITLQGYFFPRKF